MIRLEHANICVKDIDAVVIQFNNTTDPKLYKWHLLEIVYSRIVKILRSKK